MRKIMFAALLVTGLAGCANLPTINVANSVNLNTLQGVVSGYGLVVNAENALKATPLCLTGTAPSLTNICVRRSTIVRLQAADRVANQAVNAAVAFVKNNPNVPPTGYISAAQSALLAVQSVINSAGN